VVSKKQAIDEVIICYVILWRWETKHYFSIYDGRRHFDIDGFSLSYTS